MFLGIICGTYDWDVHPKMLKTKKSISKLGVAHGMIESKKWHLSKEIGPMTKEVPAEDVIKEHIQKADLQARASLERILQDYHDIFPSQLPFWPLPKW